ncbi:hypothetical protein BJ878DRAFT_499285 [Calycina marina]|uniref:Uncharacterized protein n=1 Tax=Calycina marina TaxID=1763456 RepID=A0A9P8CGN9_9HELO|nr:hypothetical protein BJ878DRAFT_499285 [Calycina marina]
MSPRTNSEIHPPSLSSPSPRTPLSAQQPLPLGFPVTASPTIFYRGSASNLALETSDAMHVEGRNHGVPLQSRPTRTPRRQARSQSSIANRRASAPIPKPISLELRPKALKLYTELHLATILEQQQQQQTSIYAGGQLNVHAPGSARSRPASNSRSAYGGTNDASLVIDFGPEDEAAGSLNERGNEGRSVYDGTAVRHRVRRQLNPRERAKASLIRHLRACPTCSSRRVPCSLGHHDLEPLERERQRLDRIELHGLHHGQQRPHSQSQLQPTCTANTPMVTQPSSHKALKYAPTGQVPEEVGINNYDPLLGLGQNDHFLHVPSPVTTAGFYSPSNFPDDPLARIHLTDASHFPMSAPPSDNFGRLDLDINSTYNYQTTESLLHLGTACPQGFMCSWVLSPCGEILDDDVALQDHYDAHIQYTRIMPAHRYKCSHCHTETSIPVNFCLTCGVEGLCETRIYGRISDGANNNKCFDDDQSPYFNFSPGSHQLSPSGFQNTSSMDYDNSMSYDNGMDSSDAGSKYNFHNNTNSNHFASPSTQGTSFGNSLFGDFQFQGNQYALPSVAMVAPAAGFSHRTRPPSHRWALRLVAEVAALFVLTIMLFRARTLMIGKASDFKVDKPCVGFKGMVRSFGTSFVYWMVRVSMKKNQRIWGSDPGSRSCFDEKQAIQSSSTRLPARYPKRGNGSSPSRFFRASISIC